MTRGILGTPAGSRPLVRRASVSALLGANMAPALCLAAMLCFAAFPGLAHDTGLGPSPEDSLTPVVLQLKWRHQFQFAGYYAALDQGYYAEAGLDVDIREGGPGISPYDEVESGQAQFGVCGPEVLQEHVNGRPFVVLAAVFQHSPSVLLVLRSSGIRGPHDLVGKTIMISHEGEPDLRAMFLHEGIGLDQFTYAETTWDLEELVDGSIDATAAYITNTPFFLKERFIPYTMIRPATYGVDFYGDGLFTSQAQLQDDPQLVERFRAASLMGWEYALEHPEEAIDLIMDHYSTDKSREHLAYEARTMRELILPDLVQTGHMNPGRWESMARVYQELSMIEPGWDLDGFMYDPTPDMERLLFIARLTLLISLAVGVAAVVLVWFNRRLRREMRAKEHAVTALRQSEKRFRAVYAGLPVPALTWQARGQEYYLTDFNQAADGLLENTAKELLGQSVADMYPAIPAMAQDIHACGKDSRVVQRTLALRTNGDEEERITAMTFAPIGQDLVLMLLEDVTEREQARQALLQAKVDAEAASRMKTEFLANTSHEIRTPMNAILGMADLMRTTPLSSEQRDYMDAIAHWTHSLLDLINSILDFSEIEAGSTRIICEPFSLKSVVQAAAAALADEAEDKGLDLTWYIHEDAPGLLMGDGVQLKRALVCLVDNGVKFTPQGAVEIEVVPVPGDDAPACPGPDHTVLRFSVRDTGIGIAPDDQQRIFESFTQADGASNRHYGGTGLGLAMARRLVELMGGSIELVSEPGKGSEFSFTLALARAEDLA